MNARPVAARPSSLPTTRTSFALMMPETFDKEFRHDISLSLTDTPLHSH